MGSRRVAVAVSLMPSVTVVTPWWNHPELMPAWWDAINQDGGSEWHIVVDNGSDPPIRPWGSVKTTIIRNERNVGFSRACNQGLHDANTDAVLFLNNDIQHTRERWLDNLRDELAPGVLVGAQLRVDAHCYVDGRPIPYLDGWCLAGMRDDLLALGGWDTDYEEPSYFGDNDLCLRARRAGMKLVQVDVGLRHISNVTSRSMNVASVSRRNYERYAARARELLAAA
jgi:GT2 family glycosyltransferase